MPLLLVITLTRVTGRAQDLANGRTESTGSDPVGEAQQAGKPIEWSSSDAAPEGFRIDGSTDVEASGDAPDVVDASSYDSYLRISGAALKPRSSHAEWHEPGGCIYVSGGWSYVVFNVPLYLPQGATVKYLRMYYADTSTSTNSTAQFIVYDVYGAVVQEYGASSTGSPGNRLSNNRGVQPIASTMPTTLTWSTGGPTT